MSTKRTEKNHPLHEAYLPFGRMNYMLMAIGFGLIILGFILMSGSENIYSFTKLTLSTILVIGGFVLEIVAIMWPSKDDETPVA